MKTNAHFTGRNRSRKSSQAVIGAGNEGGVRNRILNTALWPAAHLELLGEMVQKKFETQIHKYIKTQIYKGRPYWHPLGGVNKNLLAPPGGVNKNLLAPPRGCR